MYTVKTSYAASMLKAPFMKHSRMSFSEPPWPSFIRQNVLKLYKNKLFVTLSLNLLFLVFRRNFISKVLFFLVGWRIFKSAAAGVLDLRLVGKGLQVLGV